MNDKIKDNDNEAQIINDVDNNDSTINSSEKNSRSGRRGSAKGRKFKLLSLGFITLLLVGCGGLWLLFGNSGQTRIRVPIKDNRAVNPNRSNGANGESHSPDSEVEA